MSSAHYQLHAHAVITLDNPPVNGLGYDLRCGIVAASTRRRDPRSRPCPDRSDRAFSGGADIREFGSPKSYAEPNLLTVIRIVEACSEAGHRGLGGICMGGASNSARLHFRVAMANASIALPEIKLGCCPGPAAPSACRHRRRRGRAQSDPFGHSRRCEKFKGTPLFDEFIEGDSEGRLAFAAKVVAEKRR